MKIYRFLIIHHLLFNFTMLYGQSILDKQFKHYVPKDTQKECDGLGDICKKFYVGYYLLDYRVVNKQSLEYLVDVYEHDGYKIIKHMEAKPYYLTMTIAQMYENSWDLDNALKYYKLAIKAKNERAICSLGIVYQKQKKDALAIEALKKGADKYFPECYTNLGMYYFNDKYGAVDKELGGEYWKKAYEDTTYGAVENYNLGVYYEYKGDKLKTKYHILKASLLGDNDAKRYLKNHLQSVVTTTMFVQEALGSHFEDVRTKKVQEFSNYDLYYRFKKMFNRKKEWEKDTEYEDARWDRDMSIVSKFDKYKSSLIFEKKKVILQTTIYPYNRNEIFLDDMELFYKVIFVDLTGAKNVVDLHHELVGRIVVGKDFNYSREFSVDGFRFVWSAKYDEKTKKLYVEISAK